MTISQINMLHRGSAPCRVTGGRGRTRAASGEVLANRQSGLQDSSREAEAVEFSEMKIGGAEDSSLEVAFYKEILDHFGFPHRCEVMRVSIAFSGEEQSIIDAIHEFERLQRVSNWRHAADRYEVVSAAPKPNAP